MSQPAALRKKSAYTADPVDLLIVGFDFIDEAHPLNDPRATWPVDEALAANIRVHGVIEPVNIATDGDRLLVVDGRQRVKSARLANVLNKAEGLAPIRVPLVLRGGGDSALLGVMVSANEHRKGSSMMTKATLAQRLLDLGMSHEEVAIHFGVDVQSIKAWTVLLKSSGKVRKAVDAGLVPPSAAIKLARLERAEQDAALEELLADGGKVTTEKAEVAAKKRNGKEAATRPTARLIRKVVARAKDEKTVLDEQVIATLEWVLGESKKPSGLATLLRKIEAEGS